MKGLIALIVAIIVIGGGYYWYTTQQAPEGSSVEEMTETAPETGSEAGTQPDTTSTTPPSSDTSGTGVNVGASASVSTGTTKEFTVTGKNFSFAPSTMTVKKGDTVKITFVNSAGTHDLRVDGYNVGTKTIQGGTQETITFVADKVGSFEYYCSIGNHRAMGMKGTLTVQ
ncbi:hypothetical protein A2765_03965 [Candidatus Kaiserbacteria bacterium RIFCSPHIGHO2_01_FULL_56_24]|uniref:EfeO-type cupredoxin-like domain-containing protein n=1 Tax=Candidatus Kaiserbacteria bacterium RIFCSPHIGHO2_01_FULL_56_24 TaxID=1798487 RepID=A0A1F6DE67_9BACT|nr:MAG: hypothetical protein A2765_03965 [Candidatus Kaiserbacteria bacterium RIFCSPHIGHO2_01_FULL_56_24]